MTTHYVHDHEMSLWKYESEAARRQRLEYQRKHFLREGFQQPRYDSFRGILRFYSKQEMLAIPWEELEQNDFMTEDGKPISPVTIYLHYDKAGSGEGTYHTLEDLKRAGGVEADRIRD